MMKCRVEIFPLIITMIVLAGCGRGGKAPEEVAGEKVVVTPSVLAVIAEGENPTDMDHAVENRPSFRIVFHEQGRGVAYLAERSGAQHVVFNGRPGKSYESIENIRISPDGRHIAHTALVQGKWIMVRDGVEGEPFEDVGAPVFSPDSRHLAYRAKDLKASSESRQHIVVDSVMSDGYPLFLELPEFSGDSTRIVFAPANEEGKSFRLIVSDLELKNQTVRESTTGFFMVNKSGTLVASLETSGNGMRLITFAFGKPNDVTYGPYYDDISQPAFSEGGDSVVYVGERGGKRFLQWNGREELLPEGTVASLPVVRPDRKGVSVIMGGEDHAYVHHAFLPGSSNTPTYESMQELVFSPDGSRLAYAARKGEEWFVVVNGRSGPSFDRVVSPVFSPDGKRLVYRVRKDGKRFVVVADADGGVIKQHPTYEMVFPVVFAEDGLSVAYGVKDGRQLAWKVEKL